MENAEKLARAVQALDVEASLKLLQDAGGACQARDLAKAARAFSKSDNDFTNTRPEVNFALNVHGNKETLGLYFTTLHRALPVVELEQDICKR